MLLISNINLKINVCLRPCLSKQKTNQEVNIILKDKIEKKSI
jgi:hypothetical protein